MLDIYQKIELKYDKTHFLNTYLDCYTKSWDKVIEEYLDSIHQKIREMKEILQEMSSYFDGKYMTKVEDYLYSFLISKLMKNKNKR